MPTVNIKTKEQMLIATLDSLQKNVGINSITPGSIARAFAEAIHSEIYDLYNSLKLSIEQSNLSTASGNNLDIPKFIIFSLCHSGTFAFSCK